MQEEIFSAEEGLQVIRSMINKTKENMGDNSIYFLMWGWLVLIACLLQYFLLVIIKYRYHYLAWSIIIVGIVFSILYTAKQKKQATVKTYIGDSMSILWTGMSFSFMAIAFIFAATGWEHAYPIYILLYATGTFVSGGFIKFRPLQVGGAACWILAIAAAYASYQNQILLTAASILVSYIIPGYLLKNKYRKTN